jgi:hypothetical protein
MKPRERNPVTQICPIALHSLSGKKRVFANNFSLAAIRSPLGEALLEE